MGVEPDVDDRLQGPGRRTRRFLLDRLHEENGQTLGELCERVDMTRQAATQHLGLLEAANLVTTVRRGREKFHYLNPVPLHEIQERWIDKFERPRLRTLSAIATSEQEDPMTDKPSYVYVTYIEATPEQVWEALTGADLTGEYWGHRNEADTWDVGGAWRHASSRVGATTAAAPSWRATRPAAWSSTGATSSEERPAHVRVTFTIEPHGGIVRLTVHHEDLIDEGMLQAISGGWPAVLSNLKSLLETGSVLPEDPWEVPARLTSAVGRRTVPGHQPLGAVRGHDVADEVEPGLLQRPARADVGRRRAGADDRARPGGGRSRCLGEGPHQHGPQAPAAVLGPANQVVDGATGGVEADRGAGLGVVGEGGHGVGLHPGHLDPVDQHEPLLLGHLPGIRGPYSASIPSSDRSSSWNQTWTSGSNNHERSAAPASPLDG